MICDFFMVLRYFLGDFMVFGFWGDLGLIKVGFYVAFGLVLG